MKMGSPAHEHLEFNTCMVAEITRDPECLGGGMFCLVDCNFNLSFKIRTKHFPEGAQFCLS